MTINSHHEAHGEDKSAENFDDAGVGLRECWGTSLYDLREQASEREHDTSKELSGICQSTNIVQWKGH